MKKIVLILGIFMGNISLASPDAACNIPLVRSLIPRVVAHSPSDKNRHCSISCLLGLRCSRAFVIFVAYSKEIQDVFTPGDADWQDIRADDLGLDLAKSGSARNDKECFQQCDLYY